MPEPRRKLPSTLTILPTYKCTAACKECCFQSNPMITQRVPQERLLRYIDEAAALGSMRLVCFSGGEAFTLRDDLVALVERCASHGLLTRIVTNGYWAASDRHARARLEPLVEVGLNEINFSTGDDHVEYVPVERVLRGLSVSLEYGLGLALMIEARAVRRVTRATVLAAARAFPGLHRAIVNEEFLVVESPWMAFAPGTETVGQPAPALANARNVHLREPCTSIFSTVVVTPSEQLGLCCGLAREGIADLHAGSLREAPMKDLLDRSSRDFLKMWIFVEGPERILAWAAGKDPSIQWEDRYAHNCDACRAMYTDPKVLRAIQDHYLEKYDEVLAKFALYVEGRRPGSTR